MKPFMDFDFDINIVHDNNKDVTVLLTLFMIIKMWLLLFFPIFFLDISL